MHEIVKIAGAVMLPQIGGFLGSFITRSKIKTWYEHLKKPCWRPPNWLFAPVWLTLYSAMGYASYLVWRDGGGFHGRARLPLQIYGGHLMLNWLWTPIFFGMEQMGFGFFWLVLTDVGIVATMVSFWEVNQTATLLLVPYLGWGSFAGILNFWIWRNNPKKVKS